MTSSTQGRESKEEHHRKLLSLRFKKLIDVNINLTNLTDNQITALDSILNILEKNKILTPSNIQAIANQRFYSLDIYNLIHQLEQVLDNDFNQDCFDIIIKNIYSSDTLKKIIQIMYLFKLSEVKSFIKMTEVIEVFKITEKSHQVIKYEHKKEPADDNSAYFRVKDRAIYLNITDIKHWVSQLELTSNIDDTLNYIILCAKVNNIEALYCLKDKGLLENTTVREAIVSYGEDNIAMVIIQLFDAGLLTENHLITVLSLDRLAYIAAQSLYHMREKNIAIDESIINTLVNIFACISYDSSDDSRYTNDYDQRSDFNDEMILNFMKTLLSAKLVNTDNLSLMKELFENDPITAIRFIHAICRFEYSTQYLTESIFDFLIENAAFSKPLANILFLINDSYRGWSDTTNKMAFIVEQFENNRMLFLYANHISEAMKILRNENDLTKERVNFLLKNPKHAAQFVQQWKMHLKQNQEHVKRIFEVSQPVAESKATVGTNSIFTAKTEPKANITQTLKFC